MLTVPQAEKILSESVDLHFLSGPTRRAAVTAIVAAYNQGYNDGYASAVAHVPLFL